MNKQLLRFSVSHKVALLLILIFGLGLGNKLYLLRAVHDLEGRVKHFVAQEESLSAGATVPVPLHAAHEQILVTASSMFDTLAFLIVPVWIGVITVIGWVLVRSILKPLRRLHAGAVALGQGDMDHRIALHGSDEFAALSRAFNAMAQQLQATTVSRQELAQNQEQLQSTVIALSAEMAQREKAERARLDLADKLRRAETLSVLGAVVGGVAHEVRNPLFGISSTLDAMRARFGAADEQKRYLNVLDDQVKRLSALMEDLLEYGKPPALELKKQPLRKAIDLATTACEAIAKDRLITIANHVDANDAMLNMDAHRLAQVFRNLLENAIHHGPIGSTVTVEAEQIECFGHNAVVCTVRDSGPGFPQDDLVKLFSPFFSRRRGGTGLGLSIAQRIVEQHGGVIEAVRPEAGGAEVRVTLPLSGSFNCQPERVQS